jgi:hypothetical protein
VTGPPDNAPGFYDTTSTPPRCRCGHPSVTVDLYNGRRCRCCHPAYSPDVAARLVAGGWPSTADAYRRSFAPQETP